ncbi:FAD:protein FMN transferase [bacterium]|nr:FAD:protein FMN transferase [bacterium]
MLQKNVIFLSILLLFFSCSTQKEISLKGVKMGIPYSVKIRNSNLQKEQIEQVIEECFALIDTTMNGWNPSSEISRWNASKDCSPTPISPALFEILQIADAAYTQSRGYFDPSLGKAIRRTKKLLKIGQLLSDMEISALYPSVGWDKVVLHDHSLQKLHPEVEIDLDGISKGYFCDICTQKIKELGASHVLVEWGGEVKVAGGPFRVLSGGNILHITNSALATSGYRYQLYPVKEGSSYTIYSHFLDPNTLKPIPIAQLPEEFTQKHPSCAMADALSTYNALTISSL